MQENYSQGSLWRKWDLHIHSNASDGTGSPKEIINKAKEKQISVIAITDHHTAKNIDELKLEGEKEGIAVISGIEFRTEYGQKSVHMIGVFPDSYENTKLDSTALHNLVLSPLNLSETRIIASGREKHSNFSNDKAFKEGMFLVQVDFKTAANKIHELGGLVIVHAGSKSNSLEELKHEGKGKTNVQTLYDSLGVVKDELFEKGYIDICEIRKENDNEDFYYTKFDRPSIVASDAHDFNDIGSKYVWIKADPTFEGLKQIKYESQPGTRVYIGETFPQSKDINRVISSIQITNSNGWFEDKEISLNPNLCCIIGSKGSGKTALADLIGLVGGDIKDINDQRTFIGKAIRELNNTQIKIKWLGGLEDKFIIGTDDHEGVEKKVQYLSQGFVEKICSQDLEGAELIKEIEKVIFENLDEVEKRNYIDFDNLREVKTNTINQKKEIFQDALKILNKDIFSLQQEIKSLPEKKKSKSNLENEKIGIEKQKGEIMYSSDAEKKIQEKIEQFLQAKNQLINKIAGIKLQVQTIDDLKNRIEIFEIQLKEFYEGLIPDLKSIGIGSAEFLKFQTEINPETKIILNEKRKVFEEEINKLEGDPNSEIPLLNTLAFINREIEKLQNISTLEKSKKDKLENFQKRIKQIDVNLAKIISEINGIENEKISSLQEKREKRWEQYNSFFKVLEEENTVLKKLYEPIQRELQISDTSDEQQLGFETKKEVDYVKLGDKMIGVIDSRKKGKYLRAPNDKIYSEINEVYSRILKADTDEERKQILTEFIESFKEDGGQIEEHLRDGYSLGDFYDSVFSTDEFKLNYSMNFNGVALDNLTPGTKGIALLILYLGINKNEYRPLIIDQPEENLDNRSVYKVLKEYFRNAKLRRQIIMITHNPNLVVNTDAEQIIVANFDKECKFQAEKICYISGSLENTLPFNDSLTNVLECQGIREHTCEILEGGQIAFEEREHKYRIN